MRVPGQVALVHDYLNQRGGAERVALEIAQMHPEATLSTSVYRPESTFPEFGDHPIRTSFLDRAPVDCRFRNLLPLYPTAMRNLGPLDADVVIASSSGWAHGVRTTERTFHVVYCHNPARWLYGADYMGACAVSRVLAKPLFGPLRRWDKKAAARAGLYIANSKNTRARIAGVYGRDAVVVPPPVDVERFTPRPRGERLLVVNRLLPYKRVDLIVEAATKAGLALDVVGAGPHLDELRAAAGPTVSFHGALRDEELTELFETCRALCVPGEEDFGIAAVEAQAAGKPVVAYASGGSLETVADGVSGTFFAEKSADSLIDALRRCDRLDADHELIATRAQRFSRHAFRRNLASAIANAHREWLRSPPRLEAELSAAV